MGWLSGYDKRIKLTIDHTKVDDTLSDFPVTVFFTSTQGEEIFTEFDADSDYMKCAFTSSDGTTQLYAEKELFDVSEQKAIYHVKVTSVSSSAGTDIYYYYDNDHADNTTYIGAIGTTAGENVWDSNFKTVYHMVDNTTSTILDSTSNDNDGTKTGANEPIETTGKVGQGQDFDGSDDYIDCGDVSATEGASALCVEAVIKADTFVYDGYPNIVGKRVPGGVGPFALRIEYDIHKIKFLVRNTSSTEGSALANDILNTATWYYLAGNWDGTDVTLTINDVVQTDTNTLTGTTAATTEPLKIGMARAASNENYDGIEDEIRVSISSRSTAWRKATYNTLYDTLLTYGSEETKEEEENNSIFFGMNF